MALPNYYRSLEEGQQYLVLGLGIATAVLSIPLVAGTVPGELRINTRIPLGGILVTGALSIWSTRQIKDQFEDYFSILRKGQVYLARILDNIDGGTTRTVTDGGAHRGRTSMHERKSGSNVNTSAAISGALTGSALFMLVAFSLFGEFTGVWTLALFPVAAVGGVLGAYAGDRFVRWGHPTHEPHPLPPVDPETILAMVDRSDLDRRAVAAMLLAADRDERSDEAS